MRRATDGVKLADEESITDIMSFYMGENTKERRQFIMKNLTTTLIIFTVVLLAAFFIYCSLRIKTGKVQMEKSYELQ